MPRRARLILLLLVLAGLGWYVWAARDQLAIVFHFDPRYLLPMLLVPALSLLCNGLIGRDLAAEFGVRLARAEWFGLAVVNSLANYLPLPQGGAVARGVYLKKVHRLPWATYAATLVVTYVSSLALSGASGLAGLAVLAAAGRPSPPALGLVFAGLAASAALFTPAARWLPLPGRLANLGRGLEALRSRRILLRILLLQGGLIALATTGLWLACRALPGGEGVTWPAALMLGLMVMTSGIANVTPGNVGVEQGVAELTGRLLDLPPQVGFLAALLFRFASTIVVFALGPFFSHWLARQRPADRPGVLPEEPPEEPSRATPAAGAAGAALVQEGNDVPRSS